MCNTDALINKRIRQSHCRSQKMPSFRTLVFLLSVISILASCGRGEDESIDEPIKVQLTWVVSPEHAFLYHGQEQGFFSDGGPALEIIADRGSHKVVQAFDRGDIDFGFVSGDSLVLARSSGIPIRALFVLFHESPAVLVSKAESGLESLQDVVTPREDGPVRVGVIKESTVYPQLHGMFRHEGISYEPEGSNKNVEEVIAVSGGVAQLATDQIDILTHYENYAPVFFELEDVATSSIRMSDHGIEIYSTVFATTDEMIRRNPDLVQKMVSAMLDSLHASIESPDQAIRSLIDARGSEVGTEEYVDIGVRLANQMLIDPGIDKPHIPQDDTMVLGFMSDAGWEATQRTLIYSGQIDEERKLATAYFYDPTFLNNYYNSN